MKKYKLTFFTFFLAIFIMLIICAILKMAPFGPNTLMIWDMEWQYSSFFAWFRNVLVGNADWKYSLNGGFGSNTMGLISYYLASPLNLILLFFNTSNLTWGILVLTLIKTGLIAASMQYYLFQKHEDFFSVLFGCMYSFSSYVICYQSNIMWLDALILLPIVVYGIEQLVEYQKGTVYSVSLGLSIITNYYMGYMLCIFSVIYFTFYLLAHYWKSIRQAPIVTILFRFIISSMLAGGLSAFITLPTIYNLASSSNKHMQEISALLNLSPIFDAKDIFPYFMSGGFNQYQGISGGIPLIYCGIFPVFLVLVYFTTGEIFKQYKFSYATILFLLFFSMNSQGPYMIWHGCYAPVGSPWRFSFIWTFLFITIAYLGLETLKHLHIRDILPALTLILVYFTHIIVKLGYRKVALLNIFIICTLSVIYIIFHVNTKKSQRMTLSFLAIIICGFELCYNAYTIHNIQFPDIPETQETYTTQVTTAKALLDNINQYGNSDDLFRTEILQDASRSYNDGYLYNINSLTTYTSAEKQITWDLFTNLGWGTPIYNSIYDNNSTRLARSLSGIKYFITSNENLPEDYTHLAEYNNLHLYENENTLPLGFVVNSSALEIDTTTPDNLFEYQNSLYQALYGSSGKELFAYSSSNPSQSYLARIVRYQDDTYTDGLNIYEENKNLLSDTLRQCKESTLSVTSTKVSVIEGRFSNDSAEEQYVCFTIPYEKAWTATVDNELVQTNSGMGGFLLVPLSSGEHTVKITYHVPYFGVGCLISVICLFCIFLPKIKYQKIMR